MIGSARQSWSITAIALAFEGGLGLLAWGVCWSIGRWPLPGVAFGPDSWPAQRSAILLGIAATIPMLGGMWLIDRFPVGPLKQLQTDFERYLIPLFAKCNLFQFVLISLAAGIGEEMLFRGLIQSGLQQWLDRPSGLWIALGVASVVFGLAHMVSMTYAVIAALIGAYLGALLIVSGNLLTPIVAHGLYDFVALVYLVPRTMPKFRRTA